jgi:hypothetical protein
MPVAESGTLTSSLFLKLKASSISFFAFAVSKTRIQGISRPPCGRSEDLLDPVVRQKIDL